MSNSPSLLGSLPPVGGIAAALAGVFVLYLFLRSMYQAFFNPLAKVPGPKVYASSDLPYLYHLLRGSWSAKLKTLHDLYGPAVRYTPNSVSFITAGAWKTIYGHPAPFQKDFAVYRATSDYGSHPNILIASDADHRRQRRLLAHAFSHKALRAQEPLITHYATLLITTLHQQTTTHEKIDLVQWYNFTTFDLIGDLAFGEPFGCLARGGYHPWVSLIFAGIRLSIFGDVVGRYPALKRLVGLAMPARLVRLREEHRALSERAALRRLDNGFGGGGGRGDFMEYILRFNGNGDGDGEGGGMTVGEIVENASVLIAAGSETTATMLSGTTFWLLRNRDKYERLVGEIRKEFEREEDITMLGVGKLEYLNAVIEEGFRMYPPAPIALPRRTPPEGECIEGYWIPGDTSVGVPQWASYQSESNFRDASKFVPERWLGDPKYAQDARDVLQPFSIGPRSCIGKNLAYAEIRMILARLLWNFDLELMPESRTWNDQKVYTLWEKGAMNVKLSAVSR